jgi:large subunit ribosomal protein L15
MAVVNLSGLNSNFKDGETINARALLKAKLISTIDNGLKILSSGEINKKFIVEANAFSKTAKAAIEKAGGEAKLVGQKKVDDKKKKNKKEAPAEAAPKEEKPAAEEPKK